MEYEMGMGVVYNGKSYDVKIKKGLKTLKLYNMGIKNITDIEGLDNLTDLQVLNLSGNKITEIKGLENLTNLERLLLYNNQISEIKGLENMAKLRYFTIWKNPYHKSNKEKFGGTGHNGQYKDPQAIVRYCQLTPEQRDVDQIKVEKDIEMRILAEQMEEEQLEEEQIEEVQETVVYDGKSYNVKIKKGLKTLKLYNMGIKNITDIEGLDNLMDLQVLNLSGNNITEIKGLENLTNMERLLLYNNQISEIKGLENMAKLRYFTVWKNPFHKLNKDKFGGTGHNGQYKDPQAIVSYCQLTPEQREEERIIETRIIEEQIKEEMLEEEQIEEVQETVVYDGKSYEVKIKKGLKTLKLYNMGIKNITDIEGLDNLTDLQVLNLAGNNITEIKGLENLTNLEKLLLYNNQISEIEGIDNLIKLSYFTIWKNPFHKLNKEKFGGTGVNGQYKDPQAAVEYSRHAPERRETLKIEAERIEAERMKVERLEAERLGKERDERERQRIEAERLEAERIERKRIETEAEEERIKSEATKNIEKLSIAYKEITFEKISSKTGLDIEYLENLIENLIISKEIDAVINGDTLSFKKTVPESRIEIESPKISSEFNKDQIKILRGGDWKIEGNQSVFYYKVKVENDSSFLIGNIQIFLTSIPKGLDAQSQAYQIDSLKPGSFESPTFKLNATESCVGDTVEGLVSYTDPKGSQQTVNVEPFKICYVCNLLTPKLITRAEFEEKIGFMEEKKLIIDSNLSVSDLEGVIGRKITECNFALLQQIEGSQRKEFRKFEAFAQGIYDKEDVGLSIAVKKIEDGSKLVIRAMSAKTEKITDLLKDFSVRLDDIKTDTELIKEYTSQIEGIFDKQVDLEAYLKTHLASDWEKIRNSWEEYKNGQIQRKELIVRGIKILGRTFLKRILPMMKN